MNIVSQTITPRLSGSKTGEIASRFEIELAVHEAIDLAVSLLLSVAAPNASQPEGLSPVRDVATD